MLTIWDDVRTRLGQVDEKMRYKRFRKNVLGATDGPNSEKQADIRTYAKYIYERGQMRESDNY
jgi:hypothetical protein